jgi:hypothetical protein
VSDDAHPDDGSHQPAKVLEAEFFDNRSPAPTALSHASYDASFTEVNINSCRKPMKEVEVIIISRI